MKCKNFSDSKQFFVQIYRHANRVLAIIIMGKSLRKLRRCSGLVIFGIVKTSTFIWWYPGVDMYCNTKISFMLHRLFRGYLTIGYTARYTWLYSHFLNSHVFMAILPIYSTTCALSIGAFRGPSIHPSIPSPPLLLLSI